MQPQRCQTQKDTHPHTPTHTFTPMHMQGIVTWAIKSKAGPIMIPFRENSSLGVNDGTSSGAEWSGSFSKNGKEKELTREDGRRSAGKESCE